MEFSAEIHFLAGQRFVHAVSRLLVTVDALSRLHGALLVSGCSCGTAVEIGVARITNCGVAGPQFTLLGALRLTVHLACGVKLFECCRRLCNM